MAPRRRARRVRVVQAEYRYDIRYTNNAPHLVRFENVRPGSDMISSAQELATDMRRRVGEAVATYTGWSVRQAINRVQGILSATGGRGGYSTGEDVDFLRDFSGETLTDLLAWIQQDGSNPDMTFWEIVWDFWIIPNTIVGGAGQNIRKPKWHTAAAYSQTWKGYADDQGSISCAAFAICWGLYSSQKSKHYERINNAVKDARELMDELGWGAFVTVQELKKFVDHYPSKKLVVIQPFAIPAIAKYVGTEFDPEREEADLLKDTIFLTYDPTQEHYGSVRNPTVVIGNAHGRNVGRNNTKWRWCCHCDMAYDRIITTTNPKHECDDARGCENQKKSRTCGSCQMIVNGACYSCDGRDCKGCGSKYNNNTFHRCLFMTRKGLNSHFENEDLDVDQEEDDFFKTPENEYRIIFADLESAMHKIKGNQMVIEGFNRGEDGKYEYIYSPELEDDESVPQATMALYGYTHIEQRANYCYAEDGCDDSVQKMFKGDDCLNEFLDWVTSYNDGKNIVLFHYGSGYDARLIFAAAQKRFRTELKSPIIRGTKFLELKVGNAIFRDSILHLPGSLDSLGKAFKPPGGLVKGHFPILFNYQENVGKVFDTIPGLEWFATPKDKKAYDDLKAWHSNWQGPWDFSKEIEKYVIADVKVLKYVGMEFHKTLVAATGASPWYRATAPSFTHEFLKVRVTKLMELPPPRSEEYAAAIQDRVYDFWPILEPYEDSFARRCLRGGRTDVKCMRRYLTEDEIRRGCQIRYIDVNSMYPGVQMSKEFPVGLPRIEIYDMRYIPCRNHENLGKCNCVVGKRNPFPKFKHHVMDGDLTAEEILNDDTFFGFGVFTTIPPKNIFTPLTVTYSESEKKCLATLRDEEHQEKYDTSETLKLMLRNGYKLVKVHAFHRYKKAESIWKRAGFGDLILQKMMVSGEAPVSLAERKYLEDVYEERFGMGNSVKESWDNWAPDKAKKIIYKVVINSAWGKHVQKLIQTECEVFNAINDLQSINTFWDNVMKGNVKFKDGLCLSGGSVMHRFEKRREHVKLDLHNCYTPAAIFVPEYGRIQLVEMLMKLKEPLYHDTDSVIFFHDPMRDEEIEVSDILGDWGEEEISLEQEHGGIVEFVAMGPKSYGLKCKDGYTTVKAKGIRMNYATEDLFNYDVMKYMVDQFIDNEKKIVTEVRLRFFLIIDSLNSNVF